MDFTGEPLASRLGFFQGSIAEAPAEVLAQGTVFFCAVRGGGKRRPSLVADTVRAIRRAKLAAAGGRAGAGAMRLLAPVRFYTAGFDVPDGVGATLRGGFALRQASAAVGRAVGGGVGAMGSAASDPEHGVALYGQRGPRVILEYRIDLLHEEEEGAGAEGEDARGAQQQFGEESQLMKLNE